MLSPFRIPFCSIPSVHIYFTYLHSMMYCIVLVWWMMDDIQYDVGYGREGWGLSYWYILMCMRIAIASEPAVFSRRYTRLDSHLEPRRSEFPEIVRKVHLCSVCSYAARVPHCLHVLLLRHTTTAHYGHWLVKLSHGSTVPNEAELCAIKVQRSTVYMESEDSDSDWLKILK